MSVLYPIRHIGFNVIQFFYFLRAKVSLNCIFYTYFDCPKWAFAHLGQSMQRFRKHLKKICIKGFAYQCQLMSVYHIFEKNLVDSTGVYVYLHRKPLVCFSLFPQFFPYKIAYMYLHSDYYLCISLPIPHVFSHNRKKKRRTLSSPNCGRGNYLREKTKMPAFCTGICICCFSKYLVLKFSTFQLGRNK